MSDVELDGVSVTVDRTPVLHDISLRIDEGAFAAVVGPSGSGKSTLLRAIAGLVPTTTGTLRFDGADMAKTRPNERDIAMVFQKPALLPHRNVQRNVAFPLEVRHETIEEIRRRVDAEARAMRIEGLLLKQPDELSQGEEQLVQIARSLVRVPRVLLLDEPFSALDPALTEHMRTEIGMLQAGYGVTTVMATNDPDDAMALADVLIVIDAGRVVQLAPPNDVWRHPATLGAAISTGQIWTLDVTVERDDDGFVLVAGAGGSDDPAARLVHRVQAPTFADRVGDLMLLGVRPGDVVIDPQGPIAARVDRVVPGHPFTVWCHSGGQRIVGIIAPGTEPPARGDVINLRIDHAVVFDRLTEYAVA